MRKHLILLPIFLIGAVVLIFMIRNTDVGAPAVTIPLNVRFVILPHYDTNPKVYRYGAWKTLPKSHKAIVSPDSDMIAACGDGGVYVYQMAADVLEYVYEKDWYPCSTIAFTEEENVRVTDADEKTTIDLETGKQLRKEKIDIRDLIKLSKREINGQINTPTNVCDKYNNMCATFNRWGKVIIVKENEQQQTKINNAIALLGIENNVIFYVKGDYFTKIFSSMQKQFQVSTSASYLYAYDITTDLKIKLLEEFNYGSEEIVFF
jgi:hypothetical protein